MICYFLVLSLFSSSDSMGYTKKLAQSTEARIETCLLVHEEARRQEVDILLALSIAFHESKFEKDAIASDGKGFGAMQATPRLWCDNKKKENCDLIKAGVTALKQYLVIHDYNEAKAVESYAGKGKKAKEYSKKILKLKNKATIIMESIKHETIVIFKTE